MPTPLSTERFEQFVDLWTQRTDDHTQRFEQIDSRLEHIEKRLDAIERMLWQGRRLDDHERRIKRLAEQAGRPDLTMPTEAPPAP